MSCRVIAQGPGLLIVACSRGQRRLVPCSVPGCGYPHSALCDFAVTRKGVVGTCDAKLCDKHRVPQGEGRDLCPAHARHVAAQAAEVTP